MKRNRGPVIPGWTVVITIALLLTVSSLILLVEDGFMRRHRQVGDGGGGAARLEDSNLFSPLRFASGMDQCRGFSWEPTIAVDPNDPQILAIAQGSNLEFSMDGGSTFLPALVVPAPPNWCLGGDAAMAFDSQGRLFVSYLARPLAMGDTSCPPSAGVGTTGREVVVAGYQFDGVLFSLIPGVAWPVRAANVAGFGVPSNNADKNWLAVDSTPGSPYQDRLYLVWADLTANEWQTRFSFATAGGLWQDWSAGQQLTSTDDDGMGDADGLPDDGLRPWPPHVAVAPNGDVYAATHFQISFLDGGLRVPDGQSGGIVLWRSTNGGSSFGSPSFPYPQGQADMTWNVQSLANGVIPGAAYWLQGSSQPWILPDPLVAGRVHVVANDDPDNNVDSGDPADVFIVTSNDSGQNWGAPTQVDSGPSGTFQVMPTAAIDPVTGAIGVTYYDNRRNLTSMVTGNFMLDLLSVSSSDGGLTWFPEMIVNDFPFNPDNTTSTRFCGPSDTQCPGCMGMGCAVTTRIGEYNGISFGECTGYMVWADNPVCGGGLDTLFDFDPELGGDLTDPLLACPANTSIGCTESTDPSNTGNPSVTDNCDLDPSLTSFDVVEAGNCGEGGNVLQTISRTWSSSDAAGNSDTCQQVISVTDFDPPEVTAPGPLALECNAPGGVAGDDPQIVSWLNLATAMDQCTEVDLGNNAPELFPSGCGAGQETQVIFTAVDQCGNSGFDQSSVTVADTTPPEVTCGVSVDSIWPANHKFVDVGFSYTAGDVCSTEALDIEISVTSDEDPSAEPGSGGALHCADALVQPDDSVLLRAERSGEGDGRVYTIRVTATDNCGNPASCSVQVVVPTSPSPHFPAVDSGQLYDAAACTP